MSGLLAAAAARAGFKAVPLGLRADADTAQQLCGASIPPTWSRRCSRPLDSKQEYVIYSGPLGFTSAARSATARRARHIPAAPSMMRAGVSQDYWRWPCPLRARKPPVPIERMVFLALTAAQPSNAWDLQYYTENPVFPLHDTAAVLNLDIAARARARRAIVTIYRFRQHRP